MVLQYVHYLTVCVACTAIPATCVERSVCLVTAGLSSTMVPLKTSCLNCIRTMHEPEQKSSPGVAMYRLL